MNFELESKISNLLLHLNNLKDLNKIKKKTKYEETYGIAMALFQAINYTIDIADYLVTKKKLGFPETYAETFDVLFQYKIIDDEQKTDLKSLCEYRNIIAHEYHKINKEELEEINDKIKSIYDFITIVERELK